MAMYRTCPDCGAALDPGERCECQKETDTAAPAPEKAKKKAEVHSYWGYRRGSV